MTEEVKRELWLARDMDGEAGFFNHDPRPNHDGTAWLSRCGTLNWVSVADDIDDADPWLEALPVSVKPGEAVRLFSGISYRKRLPATEPSELEKLRRERDEAREARGQAMALLDKVLAEIAELKDLCARKRNA